MVSPGTVVSATPAPYPQAFGGEAVWLVATKPGQRFFLPFLADFFLPDLAERFPSLRAFAFFLAAFFLPVEGLATTSGVVRAERRANVSAEMNRPVAGSRRVMVGKIPTPCFDDPVVSASVRFDLSLGRSRPTAAGSGEGPPHEFTSVREIGGDPFLVSIKSVTPPLYVVGMGRGSASGGMMPIIIPRLDDKDGVSAYERDEHLMLLEAARHSLEVEWTETLAAADAAADHHLFSQPSTVAYLKDRMRMSGARANRYVKTAQAAKANQSTFAAWRHRMVSTDQVDLLFRAALRSPDDYASAESTLLEIIGDTVEDTKQVLDYWRNDVDLPGVRLELEEQLKRRFFDITRRHNGMVAGEFSLSQLEGESLFTALDALMPPPAEDDSRTTSQRRADALGDLARSFLDGSESPIVGGQRPHLVVHVDLPAIQGQPGLSETDDGVVFDPYTLDQIRCDASVSRIVFGPKSEVLDVGRKTRMVPAGLRRAVVARDRHCVAPGCCRSANWCDVHHIVPWEDDGETEINNLCLLCRYHHTLLHLGLLEAEDLEIDGRVLVESSRRSTQG